MDCRARTSIRRATSRSRPGPVDDLDDAAIMPAFGGKMGIDATRKWPSEGVTREFPKRLTMTNEAARRADRIWEKIKKRGT